MQKNETFTIVLESAEERSRLAEVLYNHYQWQRHQGSGEESKDAVVLFSLFKDLSGCASIAEYEELKEHHSNHVLRPRALREEG